MSISVITNHKPLVAIFRKVFVSLSHRLQRMLLRMHQYNIMIFHKLRQQLFITDWLSRHNHETNRGEQIPGMCITIKAIESCMDIMDIPDCMTADEIRIIMLDDKNTGMLSEFLV